MKTTAPRILQAAEVILSVAVVLCIACSLEKAPLGKEAQGAAPPGIDSDCVVESEEVLEEKAASEFELTPILLDVQYTETEAHEGRKFGINEHIASQGEIRFGNMTITLPEGWKVEERCDEDGLNRCVLIDSHSESENPALKHHLYYEHEIEILPYEAFGIPKDQTEFFSVMMGYFGFQSVDNLMEKNIQPSESLWLFETKDYERNMREYFVYAGTRSDKGEIFRIRESSSIAFDDGGIECFRDYCKYSLVKIGEKEIDPPHGTGERFQTLNAGFTSRLSLTVKAEKNEGVSAEESDEISMEAIIPENFTAFISENLQKGTESLSSALSSMECGEMLPEEEVKKLSEKNDEIKVECLEIGAYGEGKFIKIDADNDGIEDIYLEEYTGGTLYLVERMLFKGYEDGSYKKTYDEDYGIHQEFQFIRWEGKNYLVRETFNFDQKVDDGVYVQSFDNGILADEKRVSLTVRDKTKADFTEITWIADEKYRELAEGITSFVRPIEYVTAQLGRDKEEEKQPAGSGETSPDNEEETWQSDIDNDGEIENYLKQVWYPSNYGMRKRLELQFTDDERLQGRLEELIDSEDRKLGYTAETLMWVDKTEFGNVTYLLYEDGLYDFYICGYIISPEQIEKILRVDFTFKNEVTVEERKSS